MMLEMKRLVIELEHRGIVPIKDAAGARIDCLRGRIWITEHESTDDIVLEAGKSYQISRGGNVVVQALRKALVGLEAPAAPQAGAGLAARIERLWSGLAVRVPDRHPAIPQPAVG